MTNRILNGLQKVLGMKLLTKLLFFLYIFLISFNVQSIEKQKIIFSIDNEIYSTIDFNIRKKYLQLLNKNLFIYSDKEILKDLISVSLFNKSKNNNQKYLNTESEIIFNNFFKIYENLDKTNDLKEIYLTLNKKEIYKNINYDLKRKKIIKNILNEKKNIFVGDKEMNTNIIYDIYLEYFSFDIQNKNQFEYIKSQVKFKNVEDTFNNFKVKKITYLYNKKKIIDFENLHPQILTGIRDNKDKIIIESFNNLLIGKITKKIKSSEYIEISFYQISNIDNTKLNNIKCQDINDLKNNPKIKILKHNNIKHSQLNSKLKDKLNLINDKFEINTNESKSYVILCDINYDKELYNKINFDEKINYLAKDIENDYIFEKKKQYNLILYNE